MFNTFVFNSAGFNFVGYFRFSRDSRPFMTSVLDKPTIASSSGSKPRMSDSRRDIPIIFK